MPRIALQTAMRAAAVTLLTDDERPLIFGKGGHLEYSQRQGREEIVKQRAEEPDDE